MSSDLPVDPLQENVPEKPIVLNRRTVIMVVASVAAFLIFAGAYSQLQRVQEPKIVIFNVKKYFMDTKPVTPVPQVVQALPVAKQEQSPENIEKVVSPPKPPLQNPHGREDINTEEPSIKNWNQPKEKSTAPKQETKPNIQDLLIGELKTKIEQMNKKKAEEENSKATSDVGVNDQSVSKSNKQNPKNLNDNSVPVKDVSVQAKALKLAQNKPQ